MKAERAEGLVTVTGSRVWTGRGFTAADVVVDGGRVAAVVAPGRGPRGGDRLDARGAITLPGAIDLHVHFRDPGRTHKEDFSTGSASAVLGGVTTVLDMPNTTPAVMDVAVLDAKRADIVGRSWVDFGLFGAMDATNPGAAQAMAEAGAAAFKLFLYDRRDAPPAGVTDDATLLDLLREVAATGRRAHVHAENDSLVKAGRRREAESVDWSAHLRSRSSLAEEEAVSRAIMFAREARAALHVCHVSSAAALALVRRARRDGHRVTAEVTPQHILRDSASYERLGPDLVMVPPVRDSSDRQILYTGLNAGDIDVVATDHAPHAREEKIGLPLSISTGLVGVQWSYPLLLTEALAGRLSWRRVIDAMSTRPARMMGWHGRKGVLVPGADADIAVVDTRRTTLRRDELASRGRSTPFAGDAVDAAIRHTLVGGHIQVADAALVGAPIGQFVSPNFSHP